MTGFNWHTAPGAIYGVVGGRFPCKTLKLFLQRYRIARGTAIKNYHHSRFERAFGHFVG
jgi:hypothetical protein